MQNELTIPPAKLISLRDHVLAGKIMDYIDDNAMNNVTCLHLSVMARHFGVCGTSLTTAFKIRHGLSIHGFIMKRRHEKICDLITRTNQTLKEIAIEAGYTNLSNFSRDFKKMAGVSPTIYRQQQRQTIYNAVSIINTSQEK